MPEFDDERPESPPAEGVRILGAEEAQAAVEARPRPADARGAPRRRRAAPAPPDDVQPAARFPLPGRSAPRRRPRTVAPSHPGPTAGPGAGEPSGPMPLPHWTEPPTGEVPMIADEPGDEEVWAAAGSQPRFRSDAGDWGEGDFGARRRRPARRDDRDGRAGRRSRRRRRRGVRRPGRGPARAGPAHAHERRAGARAGSAAAAAGVAVPDHRRRDRRATRRRRSSRSSRRATTSRPASSPAPSSPRSRLLAFVDRPRRHRGARHGDRRRRRVRALRGLPARRLPARDPARAAGLAVAGRASPTTTVSGRSRWSARWSSASPCSGTWPRSCTRARW